jgi:hypothetical protein
MKIFFHYRGTLLLVLTMTLFSLFNTPIDSFDPFLIDLIPLFSFDIGNDNGGIVTESNVTASVDTSAPNYPVENIDNIEHQDVIQGPRTSQRVKYRPGYLEAYHCSLAATRVPRSSTVRYPISDYLPYASYTST